MKKFLTLLFLSISLSAIAEIAPDMSKKSADEIYQAAVAADKDRNFDDAAELFAMAAKKDSYSAMLQLSRYYYYGVEGTTKDKKLAYQWIDKYFKTIIKKAEKGDTEFMVLVGDSYQSPVIAERRNLEESYRWYRKAANLGSAHAMYELGLCYYFGSGVDENLDEAIRFLELAVEGGYTDAIEELGELYYDEDDIPDNYQKALKWFLKDVEENNCSRCQYLIGELYFYGDGVEKDLEEARKWYEKSAAAGYTHAKSRLEKDY